jgi:hypothetical protein
VNWRDRIKPFDPQAPDASVSSQAIDTLERCCTENDLPVHLLRKALVDNEPMYETSAYAQLQLLKDKWGKAGSAIHRLEEELLERMKITGRTSPRSPG